MNSRSRLSLSLYKKERRYLEDVHDFQYDLKCETGVNIERKECFKSITTLVIEVPWYLAEWNQEEFKELTKNHENDMKVIIKGKEQDDEWELIINHLAMVECRMDDPSWVPNMGKLNNNRRFEIILGKQDEDVI